MTKREKAERRESSLAVLHKMLPVGSTVFTVLKHVSRSRMMRRIAVIAIGKEGPLNVSGFVSAVLGLPLTDDGAVKVTGCGMDMGYHVVHNLGYALFPAGHGCIGEGCPSNDHSNGDRDYRPHVDDTPQTSAEVGTDIPAKRAHRHYHTEGAYGLRHRWL